MKKVGAFFVYLLAVLVIIGMAGLFAGYTVTSERPDKG